jgi:hypothetical protein
MQASSVESTTILFTQLSLTTTSVSSRRIQNHAGGDLTNLITAIQLGDAADARNSLAHLKLLGSGGADPGSPLGAFLATVANSLASHNIGGAQKALEVFESTAANRVEPVAAAAPLALTSGTQDNPGVSEMGQDLLTLFSAIHSGDTAGAQSAYGSLKDTLESTNESNANFANQYGSSTESGSLYSLMAQIGAALDTGNLNRVQNTMDTFMRNLSSGSLVSATA